MPVITKQWDDPKEDGTRILVCRYRPRGLRKDDETWDIWMPELGPSSSSMPGGTITPLCSSACVPNCAVPITAQIKELIKKRVAVV
jgi:hypothetical protein